MRRHIGRRVLGAAGLLAGSLLGLAAGPPAAGAAPATATDAAGDAVTEAVEDPIDAPRVDIVATAAEAGPAGIVLSVRVKDLVDPLSDPNWASDASYVSWNLDVNGDGKDDYVVEYNIDSETHKLTGFMYRSGPGGKIPDSCQEPAVTFSPDAGYSVEIEPGCIGNPGSFSYRVETYYDTDDTNDAADTATDTSPAGEAWTGPVPVLLPVGVEPLAQGALPQPVAPGQVAPPPAAPQAPGPAAPGGTTPTSAKPVAPERAAKPRSRPSSAAPAAPATQAPDLARTGLADRTLRLAGFAAGIMLIGIGILFGNRRTAVR